MTVAELIKALEAMPQDLDVTIGPEGEEYDAHAVQLVYEARTSRIMPGGPLINCNWVRIG